MKPHPFVWISILLFCGGTVASAWSLSQNDSLISQSYLNTYLDQVTAQTADKVATMFQTSISPKLTSLEQQIESESLRTIAEEQLLAAINPATEQNFSTDTQLTANVGTEVSLTRGSAFVRSGTWIDLTSGQLMGEQDTLVPYHRYLCADANSILQIGSGSLGKIIGDYKIGQTTNTNETSQYAAYADALHTLGLFEGSQKGYELNRPATRLEGVVMLLRLMGKETQAKAYRGSHPFTDVPAWATSYVAYAYANGYTSGISTTQFGATMQLRYLDYMTFLLRALGYSDKNGDFSWDTADISAVDAGIQTTAERAAIIKSGRFVRDHVAYTSYRTLFARTKQKKERLCDVLIQAGVFSKSTLEAVERKGL